MSSIFHVFVTTFEFTSSFRMPARESLRTLPPARCVPCRHQVADWPEHLQRMDERAWLSGMWCLWHEQYKNIGLRRDVFISYDVEYFVLGHCKWWMDAPKRSDEKRFVELLLLCACRPYTYVHADFILSNLQICKHHSRKCLQRKLMFY